MMRQLELVSDFSHLRSAIYNHLSVDKVIEFCDDNNIGELTPVHIGSATKKEVKATLLHKLQTK